MAFLSFLYLFIVFTCPVASWKPYPFYTISHEEECLALFQFKQNVFHQDSGGFQKFESWRNIRSNITSDRNRTDCCFWKGVCCSNGSRVTGLDLSGSSLRGHINSNNSLFNLIHLQKLNLSSNNFSESQIPSEIARLKQLRILDLSDSGFNGQIPKKISHLVQLSVLDLSRNPLDLQYSSLEYLLQNLTRLEILHLSEVHVGSSVPRFLANFSSLRSIHLEDCQLQDEFPSAIFHLPKLKYLRMRNNPDLTGSLPEFHNNTLLEELRLSNTNFAGIIPESIRNLNHLSVLVLSNCHFSGRLPSSLSNLTRLTTMGLSQNQFTGPVPSLVSLSNLLILGLSDTSFENGRFPYWLSKLTTLNELYLHRMNIFDKIPPALANLSRLTLVAMRDNLIQGRIPSSFTNLTRLRYIDLNENQMQGTISRRFSNFENLEYLNLDSNNFSGRVDLDTFVGLNKLETLYLGFNNISFVTTNNYTDKTLPNLKTLGLESCNLKEFPAFLRFQKNMNALLLRGNIIEGLVPVWIWNNSQETMQSVDLSFNLISGFQHNPRFLPWVRLGVFVIIHNQLQGRMPIPSHTVVLYYVSYNNLTGEIPPSICEAKSLQVLDLSFNNLNGTLPPCLNNLSNTLSVLNLKRNNFHGPMMNAFTHGSLLRRIDLSENKFTGQLSKSITNCTRLEVLSLGDNSFDDFFPYWLGSLPELQVLLLRFNKFNGAILGPTTNRIEFSKLRIVDLSNNNFSGLLPSNYIHTWNAMKSLYVGKSVTINFDLDFIDIRWSYEYTMTLTNKGVKTEYERILNLFTVIDLSCNKFEGQIPQALGDLQGLQLLNLSNNQLTGPVLPSFGNLKNLESLDLSQNQLSGEIPQQLLRLGFLSILNVSFNHLDGRIPQGKQFNTFQNNSYIRNPRLCGEPLSKECQNSKTSVLPPIRSNESESESLLPSDIIDWIVIFTGVGSGLVIGIVAGNILYARYSDWFIERLGMGKERWVSPQRNRRRN